ncbi:MAG TPA: hypothetical protein ENK57_23795, partial [Polyangiaceae bacterium]|nr:hypothetical protein [Polyangiaceae bacterium]
LQDIVRLRRGRIIYWPGRGEGVWGTGSRVCRRGEGGGRYVEMSDAPREVNPELDGVYLSDVNMDGAADLVQVRFREVDVWFNEAGTGWTRRTIARDTPSAPAFAPRVRFTDIDGSATTDIVWANAGRWEYIDLTAGQRPRVLTGVRNGLGAQTSITYGSSAQDYLRDLLETSTGPSGVETFDWSTPPSGPDARLCDLSSHASRPGCTSAEPAEWLVRSTGSPVISTVVRSVSTSDRLGVLGRTSQVSESRFAYHDGYCEGIEQEFRGFGAADAISVGDANNPTVYSRTRFLQGRRPSELEGDRLASNPNEALKGREFMTEVFDADGVFLSTSLATMTNRHLMTGLDGRDIHYAFVSESNQLTYDTAPFVPGAATLELDLVRSEAVDAASGVAGGSTVERTYTLGVRADLAHASRVRTEFDTVTNLGQVTVRRDYGRVDVLSAGWIDEQVAAISQTRSINGVGQWLWVQASERLIEHRDHPAGRGIYLGTNIYYHDLRDGDPLNTYYRAQRPLEHDFSGESAAVGGAAGYGPDKNYWRESWARDAWGQVLAASLGLAKLRNNPTSIPSNALRYARTSYDGLYDQVAVQERILVTRNTQTFLDTSGQWDRGLGAIVSVTDPNGLTSRVTQDGLGRLTSVTPPAVAGCSGEHVATHIRYELTPDADRQPLSRVISTTELACDGTLGQAGDTLVSIAYVDGLGRARASLSTNDTTGGGPAWVRGGLATLDKKGTVRRSYQPDFFSGSDTDLRAVLALPTDIPYVWARYDAFGRQRASVAEDGAETWTSSHSHSSDVCDPLDLDPSSPHYQTCTTTIVDGFGRTIDQILRNNTPGVGIELYHLWSYYRVDGALL